MSNFNAGGLCSTTFYEVVVYIQCGFFLPFLYKSHHHLVKSIMCFYVVPSFGWEWVPKSTLKACLLITHNMLPNKYLPTFLNKKLRLNNTFGLPFSLGKFQPFISQFRFPTQLIHHHEIVQEFASLFLNSFFFLLLLQGNIRLKGVKQSKLFLCVTRTHKLRGFSTHPRSWIMNLSFGLCSSFLPISNGISTTTHTIIAYISL